MFKKIKGLLILKYYENISVFCQYFCPVLLIYEFLLTIRLAGLACLHTSPAPWRTFDEFLHKVIWG